MATLIGLSGSLRSGSLNTALLKAARQNGAHTQFISNFKRIDLLAFVAKH